MKCLVVTVSLVIALFFATMAICEENRNDCHFKWKTGIRSMYLGKPGFVIHTKPIFTNVLALSCGDFYGGFWTSLGLDNKLGGDFGEEVDLFLGWTHKFEKFTVDFSVSEFAIKNIDDFSNDLWVLDGKVSFHTVPAVQPYLEIRRFGRVGPRSPDSGWFIWPGVHRTQPIGLRFRGHDLSLELDGSLAFAAGGAFGGSDGFVYSKIQTSTDFWMTDTVVLTLSLAWQIPAPGQNGRPGDYVDGHRLVWGIGLTKTF